MAWIKTIDEAEATGPLKQLYEASKQKIGRVSSMLQALSLKPAAARAISQLGNVTHFGGSKLTRAQEDMIAVVVSSINRCRY